MRDEKVQKDTTEMDAQGRVLKTTRVIESAPANNVKDMLTLLSIEQHRWLSSYSPEIYFRGLT